MSDKTYLEKLGIRIKEIRTEKGLSQQELAAELDYEKSNMSRLESGKIDPRATTLKKVAEALGVSVSELMKFD